jgi:hypothetical protein
MYKLTRIPQIGTVPYGYEAYRLEEDGKLMYEGVTIRRVTKDSTVYGGMFQPNSEISIPTGGIEVYRHPPTCTQDSIYPIMTIPVNCTAIIEKENQPV